ncbi:MAG TPA: cob(I)yrinic acid a,c-diamide adenosyltransferase [Gemmatimonadales bacterium]|nr:cob(I)yrinic acid a,c-diamide adenosyltransferase [Gemmatimonadales bacterium]
MARIYTKTGDDGETGLFGGSRVPKDDARVTAYGEVDELNAAVGFAASLEPESLDAAFLQTIQRDLFTIGAELAKAPSEPRIGEPQIGMLEHMIDGHEAKLEPLKNFILPGGTPKAAAFHLARTVCRRAERAVVSLVREQKISPSIVKYLNRLSDLLFVLARATNARAGRPDVTW